MIKFDKNGSMHEVSGISSVTWVNSEHVCYSKDDFQKILEENKSIYAFLCGSANLRKDEEMCLVAAKNGIDIETLYRFGVLNEKIIIQSLIASTKADSIVNYSKQISYLMEYWNITPEFFGQVIEICPKGMSIASEMMSASNKNKQIKEIILNDKDKLLYCMEKDPEFYRYANPLLRNDFEVAYLAAKSGIVIKNYIGANNRIVQEIENKLLQEQKQTQETFYGIDGTKFETVEDALSYNESLINGKRI